MSARNSRKYGERLKTGTRQIEKFRLQIRAAKVGNASRATARGRFPKCSPTEETSGMPLIERQIQVTFRHQIHFTHRVFSDSNPLLRSVLLGRDKREKQRLLIVVDDMLATAQPQLMDQIIRYFAANSTVLELVCSPILMEGGEQVKNSYSAVSEVHWQVNRYRLDRHSYVLAVGGGALLDMVGLAAATAHRGLRHVRLPSTTLSQADSGVGVKNGINAFGKKNLIGTFAPPFAVINDFELITSLTPRDKRAGYVEAVKVALIRDAGFFEAIEKDAEALRRFDIEAMERLIYRSAVLHVNHIASSGDPFELGSLRPLDFGHWSAHKLEQLSNYKMRHGEAVAVGLALDIIYSKLIGLIESETAERILALLERLGFELFTPDLLSIGSNGSLMILAGLEEFREHLGGELTITLLKDIGCGVEVHTIETPLIVKAIEELRQRRD